MTSRLYFLIVQDVNNIIIITTKFKYEMTIQLPGNLHIWTVDYITILLWT